MARHDDTTTGGQARRAKARLTSMLTEAVGIVDRAANGESFLVMKRADMPGSGPDETKKADGDAAAAAQPPAADAEAAAAQQAADGAPAQKALKLPAATKDAMLTGLSAVLETLSGVAELVNGAEVDDAAQAPPELGQKLGEVIATLTGLTTGDKPQDEQMKASDAEGVEKAELDEYTAMHATVNAARDRLWGAIEFLRSDPAKAVAEVQAAAEMLAAVAAMVPQASAKAFVAKAGGRRMGKGRLSLLKSAFEIMKTLIEEFESGGEESATEVAAAAVDAAQSAQVAAAAPPQSALAKALDAWSTFNVADLGASVTKAVTLATEIKASLAVLTAKVQTHDIALAKAAKSVPVSNARPTEDAQVPARKPKLTLDQEVELALKEKKQS